MSKKAFWTSLFVLMLSGVSTFLSRNTEAPYWFKLLAKALFVLCGIFAVFLGIVRRMCNEEISDEWTKRILLLGATVSILIPLGEYAIRYSLKDITTTSHYSYFSKIWTKGIRKNRMGFREREFVPGKDGRTYRIAVIGDSLAFGQGIEETDRFSNLLETELNRIGNGYEVLNFGVPGAETVDEVRILEKVIGQAKPDFVLLQWFVNDFEGTDKSGRPKSLPLLPFATLDSYLMESSAFYVLAATQWSHIQHLLFRPESYETYMFRRFGNAESADSKTAMRELADFMELCDRHAVPLGIVLFPELVPDMDREYPFDYLHDRVISLCKRQNVPCLDLRGSFAPYTKSRVDRRKLYANRLDSHPSGYANRIAADNLMKRFGPIWLAGIPSAASGPH